MRTEIYRDSFQNYKVYGIPKAQLVIADIPYNLGNNAYASNPTWYVDGDNKHGESDKAGKTFFKVIWDNEQSMYVLEDYYGNKEALYEFEKYRIIGNIYENLELPKEVM